MKFQESPLAVAKGSDITYSLGLDPHPLQRRFVGYWRNDQFSRVLKTDETAIKQMIDTGR